jgi:hypothetical protein
MTLFELVSSLFSSCRHRGTGRGRNLSRAHLAIELLEDRQLLSTTLPETSQTGPAIITFQDQVTNTWAPYIAWKGLDSQHHLNIENLYTGAKHTLPETTTGSPALAVYRGRLFIAWTGTDPQHHLNVASSADGLNFSVKTVLGQTTDPINGPVLVVHDQALVIGWEGTDLRLNYAYSFETYGRYWTPAITLPYHSWYRPTLSTFDGDFAISWTDLADNRYRTWSITHQREEPDFDVTNLDGPSEAVDDGFPPASYLGVARTDLSTLNVYVFSIEFGDADIAVGRSLWAPSLAVDEIPDNNHFYVAWTGLDGHLHYDVLSGSAPNQAATSHDGAAGASPNGQQDVARAGTARQLEVLDQANGIRLLGGPSNVTSPNAPSLAANGDLYFASMATRNAQIQTSDMNERAPRNTDDSNHDGASQAIDVAGTRRTAWTRAEDDFSLIGGDLESETV